MPRDQLVLIPTTLEEAIPAEHPVRMVDELLDQLDWSTWEAAYHGSFGQPPIHPAVLCKILIFATLRRIRSSRQIEYALKHSIDFLWLSSGRRIDHTTLSKDPDAKQGREVAHDLHEGARRRHRQRMARPEAKEAYHRRQHPGETPFAAMKAAFDMRRFLLRGLEGVAQEWLWGSTAFNVKKLLGLWDQVRPQLGNQPSAR
jgi:hypothetical protein